MGTLGSLTFQPEHTHKQFLGKHPVVAGFIGGNDGLRC